MLRSWVRSWVRVSILRKGLSGQSRLWLLFAMLSGLRSLKRRFGAKEVTTVYAKRVKPGESLQITYPPSKPASNKRRRSA